MEIFEKGKFGKRKLFKMEIVLNGSCGKWKLLKMEIMEREKIVENINC